MPFLLHKTLQHVHIALFVPRCIDRGFGDKGAVAPAGVVEDAAKRLRAHGSLPDVLMPVQLRSALGLGIVTVPHADGFTGNSRGDLLHGARVALFGHEIVTGDVLVASV